MQITLCTCLSEFNNITSQTYPLVREELGHDVFHGDEGIVVGPENVPVILPVGHVKPESLKHRPHLSQVTRLHLGETTAENGSFVGDVENTLKRLYTTGVGYFIQCSIF